MSVDGMHSTDTLPSYLESTRLRWRRPVRLTLKAVPCLLATLKEMPHVRIIIIKKCVLWYSIDMCNIFSFMIQSIIRVCINCTTNIYWPVTGTGPSLFPPRPFTVLTDWTKKETVALPGWKEIKIKTETEKSQYPSLSAIGRNAMFLTT